jgi:hypothetical protein
MNWNWLKKVGRGAQAIAPIALMFVPAPFAPIASTVWRAIAKAEADLGDKKGPEKLQAALQTLSFSAPLIVSEMERLTGKDVVDEEAMGGAIEKMAEFQVLLTKAFGSKPTL